MRARDDSYELWTHATFLVAALVAVSLIAIGSRPGGPLPVLLFRDGLPALGLASAVLLGWGLLRCLRKPPPLQRRRLHGLVASALTLWVCSYPLPFPSMRVGRPSQVVLRLPFEGEWTVRWSGRERDQNPLVLDAARCFGVAFDPPAPAAVVVSPARGRVDSVGVRRLVIALEAEGEYLFLEGLEPRGLARKDLLEPGTPVGSVLEEGLRVSIADSPEVGRGEGIPLRFRAFLADGRPSPVGVPAPGVRVSPAD